MTFKDSYELIKFIEIINSVILDAVDHGGDSGGPYFSNENDLLDSLRMLVIQIENNNKELIEKYPISIVYDKMGHTPILAIQVK